MYIRQKPTCVETVQGNKKTIVDEANKLVITIIHDKKWGKRFKGKVVCREGDEFDVAVGARNSELTAKIFRERYKRNKFKQAIKYIEKLKEDYQKKCDESRTRQDELESELGYKFNDFAKK